VSQAPHLQVEAFILRFVRRDTRNHLLSACP
jgi:hypothetical protein